MVFSFNMMPTCHVTNLQIFQFKAFADEVMELVELDNLSDALVGFPSVTRLPTEQRKRLTIPVELVANLSIIFMDEACGCYISHDCDVNCS